MKHLYRAMVVLLSGGLACAFALGFGAPIPEWLVIAPIAGGTICMVAVMVLLGRAATTGE